MAAVPVSEVEQNLLARFPKPATPFASNAAAERSSLANFMKEVLGYKPTYHPIHSKRRAAPPGDQLLRFSCSMSTMPVRGMAAVLSERVVARTVAAGAPGRFGTYPVCLHRLATHAGQVKDRERGFGTPSPLTSSRTACLGPHRIGV